MKVKILVIFIGSILILQNCAPSHMKMTAVISPDQKIGSQETITSQKKHFVSLAPYSELNVAKDKTIFMLAVQNCGDKDPINISYDNILVTFQENTGQGSPNKINVQPFNDFMKDLRKEYSYNEKKYIRSVLNNILLLLEVKLDPFASNSVSSVSNNSTDSSFSNDSFDFSDSVGDEVENMIDDLKMDIEMMRANNQLLREALPEFVFQPRTIMPGNSYSGIVVCDTSEMDSETEGNFQVLVSVEDEEHRFTFMRSLEK